MASRTICKRDQGSSAGRVAAGIQNGYDQQIPLRQKVPVYITYFTLWANDDGSMSSLGDLYGHDARMAASLFSNDVTFDSQKEDIELRMSRELHANQARRSRAMGNVIAESLTGFIGN